MPHRCVRRKCTSGRFSASSLTDSLRSVVRLRRAESAHSKTEMRLSGLYAGTPEKSVTKAKGHLICITLNKLRVM
ncbi:hypothetical protein AHZ32_24555 [Salmonella enterica]|nr:hypothetical protein [Salmonella enterica]EDV0418529.1 hypothetical protein [Salmonella enterica subsp. enterica serovar Glostrup]EDW1893251.1 hypothetical protein [Salmonella enterica subsp. enterica serovar Abaetetuba]EDX4386393.1 hypothetical protein [Salmonella enterica subsp. enterica serovar O rough]EAY0943760.1 hypothetical protein [Salmonella enterica]